MTYSVEIKLNKTLLQSSYMELKGLITVTDLTSQESNTTLGENKLQIRTEMFYYFLDLSD